jgi:nucleotide-binding universal stress UspA family protein
VIETKPDHIVVGVDCSLNSRRALQWALSHARPGDHITLVHAWEASPTLVDAHVVARDDPEPAYLVAEGELHRARALGCPDGVELSAKAIHGDPRRCLADFPCDLLVVGGRGQGGIAGLLLGSVSAHLARHSRCPLVIVPSAAPS